MKKIIALLLTSIMCLSLCSCGGSKSPEKMLEQSQELDWEVIEKAVADNKAKAVEEYENKLFNYTASVMQIEEDYAIVSELENTSSPQIKVFFDQETLVEIQKGNLIKFVGILKDVEEKELSESVIVEITATEENIRYLKETFVDDFDSVKILLNIKDKFPKLSGEEINQILPSGWIEQRRYFKTTSGDYEQVATYSGIVKLNADGTGKNQLHGKEDIDWFVDGDYLYMKTATNDQKISKDDKYKYEVCRLDEENLICYGQSDVILLISNMLLK